MTDQQIDFTKLAVRDIVIQHGGVYAVAHIDREGGYVQVELDRTRSFSDYADSGSIRPVDLATDREKLEHFLDGRRAQLRRLKLDISSARALLATGQDGYARPSHLLTHKKTHMGKFNEGDLVHDREHGRGIGIVTERDIDGGLRVEFLFDDEDGVTDASEWRNADKVRRPTRSELEEHIRS